MHLLILQNFEAFDFPDFSDRNDIITVVPDQQSSPKSTSDPVIIIIMGQYSQNLSTAIDTPIKLM